MTTTATEIPIEQDFCPLEINFLFRIWPFFNFVVESIDTLFNRLKVMSKIFRLISQLTQFYYRARAFYFDFCAFFWSCLLRHVATIIVSINWSKFLIEWSWKITYFFKIKFITFYKNKTFSYRCYIVVFKYYFIVSSKYWIHPVTWTWCSAVVKLIAVVTLLALIALMYKIIQEKQRKN